MALTLTLAEDVETVTVEADTVSDAVFFTELDETGWHDPAEIPIKSNPDLFAHE